MTVSYKELLKQREALEQQITEARRRELTAAISQVRELVAEYGLTQQDVFPAGRTGRVSATSGTKVAPKYRDPATGQTWTGRGKAPKWDSKRRPREVRYLNTTWRRGSAQFSGPT